ncbi:MAG: 2Fe-2S iron-sulfur cluster-binding protein [Chloroflexi bacterium]|nr:2Fe-2S iron-sulfur cluster-binding protein [Chloroflexota bacterium]
MVLVEGQPTRSCLVKVGTLEGKRVQTIEGISSRGALHPFQKALIDRGAIQCGFCIPGLVISGVALLERDPDPSVSRIKEALRLNLCRCGGYPKIIEAAEIAVAAVRVQYRELGVVDSPQRVLEEDAPRLHPEGNSCRHLMREIGEMEQALRQADVVVEADFTTPFVEHAYLEPEAGLAVPSAFSWATTTSAPASVTARGARPHPRACMQIGRMVRKLGPLRSEVAPHPSPLPEGERELATSPSGRGRPKAG